MPKLFQLRSRHRTSATLRAILCALLVVAATPIGAQEQKQPQAPGPVQTKVAFALVLAVDASGSVSDDRFELQKQGYAVHSEIGRLELNPLSAVAIVGVSTGAMAKGGGGGGKGGWSHGGILLRLALDRWRAFFHLTDCDCGAKLLNRG